MPEGTSRDCWRKKENEEENRFEGDEEARLSLTLQNAGHFH
jgi:hypothetical protein